MVATPLHDDDDAKAQQNLKSFSVSNIQICIGLYLHNDIVHNFALTVFRNTTKTCSTYLTLKLNVFVAVHT